MITFNFDFKELETIFEQLDPKIVEKATVRTLNDEGRRFATQTVKYVREEYNIKASELKRYIKTDKARKGEFKFKMEIVSPPLSLSKFSMKERNVRTRMGRRKGVSVKVFKKQKRKLVKRAFSTKGQIFKREGYSRLPITKLTTLSAPQMFKSSTIEKGYALVEAKLPTTFEGHYQFYLSKKK